MMSLALVILVLIFEMVLHSDGLHGVMMYFFIDHMGGGSLGRRGE